MGICIIDYGAGNAVNVRNAFAKLGVSAEVSAEAEDWENADGLVFPGVGSFGAAMRNIGGKDAVLREAVLERRMPFLGICLGMQLLLESSEESSGVRGLGVVGGSVKRFGIGLPVPHMGWNSVEAVGNCPLFEGLDGMYAYFVHSYYCVPADSALVSAKTEYGVEFASSIWKDNLFATQFHPEKSGEKGLALLGNFIREVRK
ncbi:imidazole glycerol phosphate synthase subunit HisH [Candidatus Micrarchaeota archaeon]|nr:imidazole glycerol phosphate synthase subunit HisH [Candidatus Micrarchaeota archaeon]